MSPFSSVARVFFRTTQTPDESANSKVAPHRRGMQAITFTQLG